MFEKLEWDSNLFDLKVGKLNVTNLHFEELKQFLIPLYEQGFDLIYCTTSQTLDFKKNISMLYEIKFVDEKITYIKTKLKYKKIDNSISSYSQNYPEKKLFQLSLQSGIYSRFKVDSNIQYRKFEELYNSWIINSVQRKIAKEIFVYKSLDEILGFITVNEIDNNGCIGLIAVDSMYRGKGIGKLLIDASEAWSAKQSNTCLKVITQKQNFLACRLYESCGFNVFASEFVYHFWKKKFPKI